MIVRLATVLATRRKQVGRNLAAMQNKQPGRSSSTTRFVENRTSPKFADDGGTGTRKAKYRRATVAKTKPTKPPLRELLTNKVFAKIVAKLTGWPVAVVLIALIVAATSREALPQTMQAILEAFRSFRGR